MRAASFDDRKAAKARAAGRSRPPTLSGLANVGRDGADVPSEGAYYADASRAKAVLTDASLPDQTPVASSMRPKHLATDLHFCVELPTHQLA